MISCVWILAILFGAVVSGSIIKKKYKEQPHLFLIFIFALIGSGAALAVYYAFPYRQELFWGMISFTLGGLFIAVALYNLLAVFRCTTVINGIYQGYNTCYGGNGISGRNPVFEYTYDGADYHEQSTQSESFKLLEKKMTEGCSYPIYIDKTHPAHFVLCKRIHFGDCLMLLIGVMFLVFAIEIFRGI